VQRHRHERVGFGKELAAGVADPASHHRREIEAVAVFEGMHQGTRNLTEAHRRAGAIVGRRVDDRLHPQDARPRIVDERHAEPLAIGPPDERKLRPARRTKSRPGDRLAAGGAQPRQSKIEARAQRGAHRVGGAPEPCRGNRAGEFPHAATLAPRNALVIVCASGRDTSPRT
jgi:hypothetical protein